MKLYYLCRKEDVFGTSGTGHVAEVAEFDDGSVVVRWIREMNAAGVASTTVFSCLADLLKVHGHDGKTKVELVIDSAAACRLHEAVGHLTDSLRLAVDSLRQHNLPIPDRVLNHLASPSASAEDTRNCLLRASNE